MTDADKATALFGAVEDMPVLAVEGSTQVLESAKGMKHQLTLLDGASYFFLYANVANAVHEGSTVAFVDQRRAYPASHRAAVTRHDQAKGNRTNGGSIASGVPSPVESR